MSDAIFREVSSVERQIQAMGMAHFDIAIDPGEGRDWYHHEDLFLVQLKELLPKLWEYNQRGYRILIRPHGEHGLTLIDGLSGEQLRRMSGEGLEPALLLSYGAERYQAWLKHDRKLDAAQAQASLVMIHHLLDLDVGTRQWDDFGLLAGFEVDAQGVQLIDYDGQVFSSAGKFHAALK